MVGRVGRRAVALVAVVALTACGRAGAVDAATQEQIDGAETVAGRALDEVRRLEARVTLLERRLAGQRRASERLRDALAARTGRLGGSLERLGRELRGVETTRAAAADALGAARAAGRELAVLERRFEYHLRRYHGGG